MGLKTRQIPTCAVTSADVRDIRVAEHLVRYSPAEVSSFRAGCAYDYHRLQPFLKDAGIKAVTAPRRGSKIRRHGNSGAPPLHHGQGHSRDKTSWPKRLEKR